MSLKNVIMLLWGVCLCCKVIMSGCEVVWIKRNVTDSFRVGGEGCTNDTSVCTNVSATCREDGSCLCNSTEPSFRNPVIKKTGSDFVYGDSYGCINNTLIHYEVGNASTYCDFSPFQVIPYCQNEGTTNFSFEGNDKLARCVLQNVLVKFPNTSTAITLPWLNESYVHLNVLNNTLYFKWKRSVPNLQGTIITTNLNCTNSSGYLNRKKCLRAKILGTWFAEVLPGTTEQTVISTQPPLSQTTSNLIVPVTVTTVTTVKPEVVSVTAEPTVHATVTNTATVKPKSTSSGSSDKVRSDANVSNTALIAILAVSLIVNIFLGIVVAFLWNKMKRMQNNELTSKEMKNMGEQGKENAEIEIYTYDEEETDRGHHSAGIYDDSQPSPVQNRTSSSSDHQFEETSNYQPLRKNPLQDQNYEHHYQSLTTSQKRK